MIIITHYILKINLCYNYLWVIPLNIYICLNEITKYIDDNLEEKIEYEILAKMIGVNSYTMQRIFSLIAGISLSEYIRKRRLSNAGFDLYKTKSKIIDLAIKYQYENATSFSRAFETFHGIKPSQVNKNSKLKNFPRIIFDENIKITHELEYEIIELEEMILYGIGIKTNNKNICYDAPNFFKENQLKYKNEHGKIKYGMTTYEDDMREKCKEYFILYDEKISGFEKIIIPKSKWLLFRINSQNAKDIQKMTHTFYLDFLPSCKYNLKNIPELEYYHNDVTDFLVPIY